jgi:hypothetical protein
LDEERVARVRRLYLSNFQKPVYARAGGPVLAASLLLQYNALAMSAWVDTFLPRSPGHDLDSCTVPRGLAVQSGSSR